MPRSVSHSVSRSATIKTQRSVWRQMITDRQHNGQRVASHQRPQSDPSQKAYPSKSKQHTKCQGRRRPDNVDPMPARDRCPIGGFELHQITFCLSGRGGVNNLNPGTLPSRTSRRCRFVEACSISLVNLACDFSVDHRIVEIVLHHCLEHCRRKPRSGGSLDLGLLLKSKGGARAKLYYNSGVWFSLRLHPRVIAAASKTYSMLGTLHPQGSEAAADLLGYFSRAEALGDKVRNLRKHQWGEYSGSPRYKLARHVRPRWYRCLGSTPI